MGYLSKLDARIETNLDSIADMGLGSDERKALVEETIKLMDRSREFHQYQDEHTDRVFQIRSDNQVKYDEIAEKRKDRWTRLGLGIGSAMLGAGVTIWSVAGTWKFDRDDHLLTSTNSRGLINKGIDFLYRSMK